MMGLGVPEIAVILLIALIIFGPSQLPKLGKSMGQTIKEFRKVGEEIRSGHEDGED